MLMIIGHHIIVHGLGLKNISEPGFISDNTTYSQIIFNSILAIAVNSYVFISGYFGIKFKTSTIFSFIIQAVSYSVIIKLIFVYINPNDFSYLYIIKAFFPISNNTWWFITNYIGLYFLAPFLNEGIKNICKNQATILILGLILLNCFSSFIFGGISKSGYHIFSFILIYLLGRFTNIHKIEIRYAKTVLTFSTFIISITGITLLYIKKSNLVWQLFYYNNPFILISAISLFFIFNNYKIKANNLINKVAATTLGIYMIHDHPLVRDFIAQIVKDSKAHFSKIEFISFIILFALCIFISGSMVELMRKRVYETGLSKLKTFNIIDKFL